MLDVEILLAGREIESIIPKGLKAKYDKALKNIEVYKKAAKTGGLEGADLSKIVPSRKLAEFKAVQLKAFRWVVKNMPKQENHEFMLKVAGLVDKISGQRLNLDESCRLSPYIRYNIFGTRTGRMGSISGGFPILTTKKTNRWVIRPNNDWFLDIDYNAIDIRMFLMLAGEEQPEHDIHEWHNNRFFGGELSRYEVKRRFFAWLYGSKRALDLYDHLFTEVYPKDKVLYEARGARGQLKTPFGRRIDPPENKDKLSYLLQATSNDFFLTRALELDKILTGKKSRIAFMIHDSAVVDYSEEDLPLLDKISKTMGAGGFKIGCSVGSNFGDMRSIGK